MIAADFRIEAIICKDVSPGDFSAENCPLGEHGETIERSRTTGADHGIGDDPVIEDKIDIVVVWMEAHRRDIYGCINEVGGSYLGTGCGFQNLLGFLGQIDPDIFNAVLIPTAVGDLLRMDGEGAVQIIRSAAQRFLAMFTHMNYLPNQNSCAYRTVYAQFRSKCIKKPLQSGSGF